MTVFTWPEGVNMRFYGMNQKPKDNVKQTEYISGRTVSYNVNSRCIMTTACSLRLRKKDELSLFWSWYNFTLGGTAGVFSCSALGDGYYRFTAVPAPSNTDTVYRTLDLSIEEVY